jgi:hypothetical protein
VSTTRPALIGGPFFNSTTVDLANKMPEESDFIVLSFGAYP